MPKHQAFVDYFVHEFMEELWYLQKVTRGDIPKRAEADPWETFFNVTQGLLSLAPIPGLPLGFLLSKELVKKCVEYGEKALQLARAAQAAAQSGYQKTQEFLSKVDSAQKSYEALLGKAESKGMLQQEGPMDLTAIRILVELLARGLAERYEHVLSDYLGEPPEKSQIPLARVMAKRLFAYLQSQPLLANPLGADLLAQRTRLMNGVVLGNVDKSWRERLTSSASSIMPRVLKDMQQVELPLQQTPKQLLGRFEKFTAIGVIKRSAWYDAKEVYGHSKTDWQMLKGKPRQPKYGYVFLADLADLKQKPLDLKAVDNSSAPPRATRYYREVGIRELQAYLSCPAMQTARATKRTCPFSFHDFLREQGHPKDLQAVCHDDLSIIKDWSFATVSGVDFSGATLTGNVSGTDFSGSYLVGITAKGLRCTKEYPALFKHAQLGFSDLEKAILPKADFTQADLSLTNFSHADLTDIQSLGAIWYKTDLTGITRHDLLAEQAQQVADTQKQFRARMREMDGRITQLEQTLEPMLARLTALEARPVSAAAGRDAALEAQIAALQAQMSVTANTTFQTSCEAELRDLRARTEALRQDVDQLSGQMKVQIQDVTQLKTELTELKAQYAGQITLCITGAGDVGRKILVEQTMVQLTHRVKDLEFYLPPTVIKELPEKMTLDELMAKLNAITSQDAKTSHPEAKREHKGEAAESDAALTQDSSSLPQRFDAITVIDQFLTQEENLLLLLGEPGAGKTLSTWQATRRLIAKFTPGMSGQQISQCWLPIHVELNQFDLNDLSHLLDRQLQSFGLNAAAITKLKQATPSQTEEPRILLILDGYDELRTTAGSSRREHTDLFNRIGGAGWKAGQLKVLVTCRRRYLQSDSEERMIFGVGQYQRYQRFELLPFTLPQVAEYVTTRSAKDVGGGLLKAERYLHAIETSENIRTLVSNPFVLQLFLESLPRLNQSSENMSHLARYDLYTAFFDQWIEREVRRLAAPKKATLGRESDVSLVADFKRLARYLALSMYAKGTVNVEFIKPQQITKDYEVWFSVLKQVAVEAEQEYQTLEETNSASEDDLFGLAASHPKSDKPSHMRQAQARANQLIDLLPLSRSGSSHRFVHKSFYEYLVAASIIDLAEANIAFETAALAFLKQRLIQSEPAVLDFITELSPRLRQEPHRLYPALRAKLFALIACSAREPLHYASSNAATILNACHETFMHQSWQNVQLACADFSYANLAHSDLRGANLRGTTFIHTILYQTQLDGANCRDLIWGEQPRVQLTEKVYAIAHHPSQPWLAVAQGKNILLVNSQTGEQIGVPLTGHTQTVTSVAFSPNGRLVVSGSNDKTVRLWDVGKQIVVGAPLTGHTGGVTSVAFSLDGRLVVSGSHDETVRLWDVGKQEALGAPFTGHTSIVVSVAFSPDGRLVVSGSEDKTLRLWDVGKQAAIGTSLTGHTGRVNSVAFSPDGRLLVSGSYDNTLRLWDVGKQEAVGAPLTGHTTYVECVAFSPDGRLVVSGSYDKTLRLWDVGKQAAIGAPLTGHTNIVQSVAFSPDGRLVVSGSNDNTLRLWNVGKQAAVGSPLTGHTYAVNSVAFSPDGRWVVSGSQDRTLRLWDVGKQEEVLGTPLTGHTKGVWSVAFSPDGRLVVSGSEDKTLRLWDVGKQAAIGAPLSGHMGEVYSVAFSSDGRLVVSGSLDKTLRLWDVGKQKAIGDPLTGHTEKVMSVAFSPDGRQVVCGGRSLRLWDISKQTAVGAPLTGHTGGVWSVAFSPDGRLLVSGSTDTTLCLWDVAKQEALGAPLTGHTNKVTSVAFSPDGRLVVSGSHDRTLRLWDVASARCLATLSWHQDICSVAMIAPQSLPVVLPHSSVKSEAKDAKMSVAEDWLVFGDAAGTVSFWAVSRVKEPQIRFLGMPRHNFMPLMVAGISLRGCQMNTVSRRLLQQHGADVSQVTLVTESVPISASASSSHSVPDLKVPDLKHQTPESSLPAPKHQTPDPSLPAPKHQTPERPVVTSPTDLSAVPTPTDNKKAPPPSTTPPHQAPASIAPTSALFSPSASASHPKKSPADAKAQQLLQELYDLVDEIYPQHDPASTPQRQTLLAQLQPYQDRRDTLTVADRTGLRALRGTLEALENLQESLSQN